MSHSPRLPSAITLRRLSIEDFRGWRGLRQLDTEAGIVLLTGANGCGKTSLLEAVDLLVNGHYFNLRGAAAAPAAQQLGDLATRGSGGFSLCAEASRNGPKLAVRFRSGDQELKRRDPYWLECVGAGTVQPPPPALLTAATTYFQDRIDSILRDLERSTTLRDFLAPLPPEVDDLRQRIAESARQLPALAAAAERDLVEARSPAARFVADADSFRRTWEDVRRQLPELELPGAPADLALFQAPFASRLADWLGSAAPQPDETAEELSRLGRLLEAALRRIDERLRERAAAGAVAPHHAKLAADASRIHRRLRVLAEECPPRVAEQVLDQFAAEAASNLPGLLEVLRSVELHLQRWRELAADLPATDRLQPVLAELARLDVAAAGVLRATLEQWRAPWEAAQRERVRLESELRDLEEELAAGPHAPAESDSQELVRAVAAWRRTWDEEAGRRRRLVEAERSHTAAAARRRLAEVLEVEAEGRGALGTLQPLDEPVLSNLRRALDGTLVRFQFDSGFLPVRPGDACDGAAGGNGHRGYELHTRDERPYYVLSTGQRGQVALAYMLAQALLLRDELPHRVLVLDDTSTAFDLGNIVRQATWLRQLAYAGRPEERWQIFIASHHEELTNRLIELLMPPAGQELLLVRFLGWSPESGPEIEPRRARRNPLLDAALGRRLSEMLGWSWPAPSVQHA